jgi:hypothetical protein
MLIQTNCLTFLSIKPLTIARLFLAFPPLVSTYQVSYGTMCWECPLVCLLWITMFSGVTENQQCTSRKSFSCSECSISGLAPNHCTEEKSYNVTSCVACILIRFIGPCQIQQRRRPRAQIQQEGGSRVFYPDHAGGACKPSIPYDPLLRSRWPLNK